MPDFIFYVLLFFFGFIFGGSVVGVLFVKHDENLLRPNVKIKKKN